VLIVGLWLLPLTLDAQSDFAKIDSAVQAQLSAARIPGAALVIVEGRRVVHQRGFGVRDPSGAPVTAETPFYLGSTTKSFTALAVLQLEQQGKIELDAPVQRYLPWFTLADSAVSRAITVRDLLLHRGRIPDRAGERFLADPDTSPAAAERHVRWLARVRPAPAGFHYSNLGYTTLGLVVEAASGQPYAIYLQDHVFAPLGFEHTYTERAAARRDGLATGYALPLGLPIATEQPADRGDLAAGYLMSCAADVGRYLVAQVNQGRVPGAPGLSPDVIAAAHTSHGAIVPDRDIAFGWSIATLHGVRILDISGSVPRYLSRFVASPDSGWAVALLANGNGAIAEAHVMEAALNAARMTMGRAPVPVVIPVWLLAALGLIFALPLIQLGFAVRALVRLRRGAHPPQWQELVLAGVGVGWGVVVLGGFPVLFGSYWPTMIAYQPDIAMALLASAAIGLMWGVTRAVLARGKAREAGSGKGGA